MRNIFLFISILFMLFVSGCSTKTVEVGEAMIFPAYPSEPRILYLDTYRGAESDQANSGFKGAMDKFLGKKVAEGSLIIKPYGVGMLNDKLYVADTASNIVFVIDKKSKDATFLGADPYGKLSNPISIAFDRYDNVYVSDTRLRTVQGYNSNGKNIFTIGGRLEFSRPTGIAIGKDLNHLYVVDTKAHHIKAFDLQTKKLLFIIGKRGKGDGEFNYPTNVAVDGRNGNIVICDTQNFRIQIFDKNGNFIRKFGKIGDRPGRFARPKGVAVDSEGNIYVTDSAFNNIQIFNSNGELLLWFGGAGYGKAQFRLIAGISIDENDKIAVADAFSGRVHTFQYLSEEWKEENPREYYYMKKYRAEKAQLKEKE